MTDKRILLGSIVILILVLIWGMFQGGVTLDDSVVLYQLRLPRFVLAFVIGMSLGYAGYLMQLLVQNPLADPYVLGSSGGASMMVALFYIVFPIHWFIYPVVVVLTFIGALFTNLLALKLGQENGKIIPYRMVLIGMGIAGMSMALVSLLMYVKGEAGQVRSVVFWAFGSFQSATWWAVVWVTIPLMILSAWGVKEYYSLKILETGEEHAGRLGVPVIVLKKKVLLIATLLTALSVSFAGPIGFVGLIMPHILRQLIGYNLSHWFIPTLLVVSGTLVMTCEVLAGVLLYPQLIPAGILMSLIGVPVFIWVMVRTKSI
ncbi:MAG: iron ABC transporter permease [Cytophagaceae bacterium]